MKLGTKKPRGNPAAIAPYRWPKGVSGNPGGRPFVKIHQRLSELAADQIGEVAPPGLLAELGLEEGSTWGAAIVRMMAIRAVSGDVSAAYFLDTCIKTAKPLGGAYPPREVSFKIVYDDENAEKLAAEDFVDPTRGEGKA